MWSMINKGISQKGEKKIAVYDEEGNRIDWDVLLEKMARYWNTIYRKHPYEEGNEQIKEEYSAEIRKKERTPRIVYGRRNKITLLPESLREHYDALKGNLELDGTGKLIINYNIDN